MRSALSAAERADHDGATEVCAAPLAVRVVVPAGQVVGNPPAGGRGDGQRTGAGTSRRASGRAQRQPCACATRRAGPRWRRARWAASSGAIADGDSRKRARQCGVSRGRGHRVERRAPSRQMAAPGSESASSPIRVAHPPAAGRGDGRRVAGAGTGRRQQAACSGGRTLSGADKPVQS